MSLFADTYTFILTDSNGCTESITVEITEPEELTISEIHSDYFGFGVECNGYDNGWIDVSTNGDS